MVLTAVNIYDFCQRCGIANVEYEKESAEGYIAICPKCEIRLTQNDLKELTRQALIKPLTKEQELEAFRNDLIYDKNISHKQKIIQYIKKKYLFYCDTSNKDLTVYVWNGKLYVDNAEQIILKELTEMFGDLKHKVTKEQILDYLKGKYQIELEEKPPYLIACNNGFFDIIKKKLIPHDPKYFYTNIIPHNFSKSKCKTWCKILKNIHYQEDIEFIQEWWGYNLYSSYPVKAFLICIGSGDNGKTIELELIKHIIGKKNNTSVSLQHINNDPYGPAQLLNKLSNISDDISNQKIRRDGILKNISDGGEIQARKIYGHPFDFTPYAKISNSCNNPPEIIDDSHALYKRLYFIVFPYRFIENPKEANEKKQDYDKDELLDLLMKESEGIFYWMIQGLIRLRKNKWKFSYNLGTEEIKKYYTIKSNPVVSFINDELLDTGEDDDIITKQEMIDHFYNYLIKNNMELNIHQNVIFKTLLRENIKDSRPGGLNRKRVYEGFRHEPSKRPGISYNINPHNLDKYGEGSKTNTLDARTKNEDDS